MSIIMQNGQAVGGGATLASELTATDKDGLVSTAGSQVTSQALMDSLSDRSVSQASSVSTLNTQMSTANTNISNLQTADSNILATIRENGAHNLFPITLSYLKSINTDGTWSGSNYTINGVRFHVGTNNGMGYITYVYAIREEDSESNSVFYLYRGKLNDYIGKKLSGCPAGGSTSTYYMHARQSSSPYTSWVIDTGDGGVIPSDCADINSYIRIYIKPAFSISAGQKYFYPMIRVSVDPDTVFKAYSMTNRELNYVRTVDTEITGVSAYKCGRVVTLTSAISTAISTTSAGWITVGALPRPLLPTQDLRFIGFDNASTTRDTAPVQMKISIGGTISVYLFKNESAKPHFTITYLTNEM